jgi:hypothetical protein
VTEKFEEGKWGNKETATVMFPRSPLESLACNFKYKKIEKNEKFTR